MLLRALLLLARKRKRGQNGTHTQAFLYRTLRRLRASSVNSEAAPRAHGGLGDGSTKRHRAAHIVEQSVWVAGCHAVSVFDAFSGIGGASSGAMAAGCRVEMGIELPR